MHHAHVVLEPALVAEHLKALPGLVAAAHHAGVIGDRDHQRPDVEIALLRAGVDLEGRAARARVVDAHAVVHDPFED